MLSLFKYTAPIVQMTIWPLCRGSLNFFCHLKITGLENIKDLDSRYIVASNHNTALDPIVIRSSMPFWGKQKALYATSLTKNYYNPGLDRLFYGGFIFNITGAFPIYKGTGDYEKAFKNHISLLKSDKAVLIFPTGTRVKDGNKEEEIPRPGIIYLAEITDSPIIPVSITGQVGINFRRFIGRKHRIKIHFGKPIYFEELKNKFKLQTKEDFISAAQGVMNIIHEKI